MKKTSLRTIGASLALVLTAAVSATAQTSSSEIEQLRASVKSLQEMVLQQNAQITRLEEQKGGNTRGATTTVAAVEPMSNDIGDGYILVPNTGVKVRFNVSPRLDVIAGTNSVGIDNRFAVALLPVKDLGATATSGNDLGAYDSSGRTTITARGTNFTFNAETVGNGNKFDVFYNNDFYNADTGGDLGQPPLRALQRQLWQTDLLKIPTRGPRRSITVAPAPRFSRARPSCAMTLRPATQASARPSRSAPPARGSTMTICIRPSSKPFTL